MKKKVVFVIISVVIILLIGSVITAMGAFCPIWLETYESIYDMKFGFPFAFAEQTTDIVFNSDYFPRYFPPQYFHESFETLFLPDMFVLSLLVNMVIATGIYLLCYVLHKMYRKKHPPKPRRKKKKTEYIPVFD